MLGPFHEAPQLACTCGLHGTHDLDLLRRTRCPAVIGRVNSRLNAVVSRKRSLTRLLAA